MSSTEHLTRIAGDGYMEPNVIDCRNPPDKWVYVVMGDTDHAGTIKPIRVSYGNSCPFVSCKWAQDGEGNKYLREVSIPLGYVRRGWFFLESAYQDEGNTHGLKQFYDFQAACKRRRVFPEKGDKSILPGFPDKLLPKAVRDCVKRRDKKLEAWKPEFEEAPKSA